MASPFGIILISSSAASAALALAPGKSGPWRPPQWKTGSYAVPPLTITAANPLTGKQTAYVVDGVIRMEHERQCVVTMNPVQTGSSITDNAYVVPPRLVVEIAMSDAMQSYTIGQWAGAPTKSISAFQTLQALQAELTPMQLATRLRQYSNMMITDIRADEDQHTKFALKATITFTGIITASTAFTQTSSATFSNSAIPQSTILSQIGQALSVPVPQSIIGQNFVASTVNGVVKAGAGILKAIPTVSGAGNWSSYNVSALQQVLGP